MLKFNWFLLLGSARSCGLEKDHFSSDEAVEADNEDEVEPYGNGNENAAEASVGTDMGWADAMAKILNRKTPKSKPSILVKNRELEKEKEKLKQERLEKRKQVCFTSVLWIRLFASSSSCLYQIVPGCVCLINIPGFNLLFM